MGLKKFLKIGLCLKLSHCSGHDCCFSLSADGVSSCHCALHRVDSPETIGAGDAKLQRCCRAPALG